MQLDAAGRNALVNALRDLLDSGAGPATIRFRTGTRPTNMTDADTGTLLGTCTFSDPSAPDAANGVLTFSAITADSSADSSGTPGYASLVDSNGNVRQRWTCGVGSGEFNFSGTPSLGGSISVTSMTLTAGNAT